MDTEDIEHFKKYVVTMYSCMDVTINPRKNIDEYAGWDGDDLETYNARLDQLFENLIGRNELQYPSFLKAREFYRSIDHRVFLESGEIYDKFCEYSDGWPVLNRNWCPDKFDWIRTLGFLHKIGIQPVFRIDVRYTPTQTAVFTISLQRYNSRDTWDKISSMFEEDDSTYRVDDASSIEELRSIVRGVDNIFTRNIRQHQATPVRYTAEEIRRRQGFNFATFFETYLGQPLNDDCVVCLEFPQFAEDYLNFLSEQNPAALATFIMVQSVQFYDDDEPTKMTLKYFAPAIIAATISEYFSESDRRKQVEIFTRFSNLYDKIKSETGIERQEHLARLLQDRESCIEYVLEKFPQERVDRQYENWEIQETDYYRNLMNISTYTPDSLRSFYLVDTPQTERWKLKISDYVGDFFHTHDKPMVYYFNYYMFRYVNAIPGLKFKEKKFDAKEIFKYCEKHGLEIQEEDIKREERFLCAYRYTFDDYRNWLKENDLIAREQDDVLSCIYLDNYKVYLITACQISRICRENQMVEYLALKHFRNYEGPPFDSEDDD